MIQIPNITKNHKIWLPPIIASAILCPISTTVFQMEANKIGAGMETSGLVGQLSTLSVMGSKAFIPIILMHFLFPATLSLVVSEFLLSHPKPATEGG